MVEQRGLRFTAPEGLPQDELVRQRDVELILPRTVVDEFARNKARVVEESSRSLSGNFKRVKDAVENLEIHGKRTKLSASLTILYYRRMASNLATTMLEKKGGAHSARSER